MNLPHPAFSHLLPLEETGEGHKIKKPSPAFRAGEGARRADEGKVHGAKYMENHDKTQIQNSVTSSTGVDRFILVHGTWASGAPWTKVTSPLANVLLRFSENEGRKAVIETVAWSGWNWAQSRKNASKLISKKISEIPTAPNDRIFLIGHSHGGNAIAYFLNNGSSQSEAVKGCAFFSTPFYSLRERPTSISIVKANLLILSIITTLLSFVLLTLFAKDYWAMLGQQPDGFVFFLNFSINCFVIYFLAIKFLPVIHNNASKYATKRIDAHQTSRLPNKDYLFLRSSGDEAAGALSFGQFLTLVANKIYQIPASGLDKLYGCIAIVSNYLVGKLLLAFLLMAYLFWVYVISLNALFFGQGEAFWTVIKAYVLTPDPSASVAVFGNIGVPFFDAALSQTIKLMWYPYFIATLIMFSVLFFQALFWLIGSLALLGFGWIGPLDAILLDFAVEPLPLGGHKLHHIDWDLESAYSTGLNHSMSYSTPEALQCVADWLANQNTK